MPRPKPQSPESALPEQQIDEGPTEVHSLLRWVAERIVVRNVNGKRSDKFCALCKEARRRHEVCKHSQIWAITDTVP
jgi:hypothetical protein